MVKDNSTFRKLKASGKLSADRIAALEHLMEMADRLSTKPYLTEDTLIELKKKYEVLPDVITWGDYFSTEIASVHAEKSDDEFYKVISLVCFDLIAAVKIFTGKDYRFYNFVKEQVALTEGVTEANLSDEQKEAIHLSYLMQYFENMGLDEAKLSQADLDFFEQFSAAEVVG